MTRILFAHGAGATPDDPPLPALRRLLGPGYQITAPDLGPPDPDTWTATLAPLLRQMESAILIGHSLGGSHILKTLAELGPAVTPRAFVGLACPLWGQPGWDVPGFALPAYAPEALARLPIRLFHARDDDVVPVDHLTAWKALLPQARLYPVERQGHQFTGDLSALVIALSEL
ncbi:alpha/beta fold hydrolase [Pseudooceanicola onchidii]|uniref:alpha/beta fold hydrolase n=1 Tax=Pseudooceanicola onchidii TaxID=2562279 RepID=UPI0010AA0B8E|nr:alpha/beta fold hydrolase [Pseudooceanicola onchidii]